MIINVEKVYYPEKDNEGDENSTVIRDIQTVSDFLRAITMILSNYFILDKPYLDQRPNENLFTLDNKSLRNIMQIGVLFRGQSSIYPEVLPGVFRQKDFLENENELISKMEISLPKAFGRAANRFERLSIMQHYGLKTRILDLTSNALIALYFAVSDFSNKDGMVYLYKGNKNERRLTSKDSLVAVKASLAMLTYNQKLFLAKTFSGISDKGKTIDKYMNEEKIDDELSAVSDLYRNLKLDSGYMLEEIKISDLFGEDLVYPAQLDDRIINQSGAFLILGLDGMAKYEELYEKEEGKNEEIRKLKEQCKSISDPFKNAKITHRLENLVDEIKQKLFDEHIKRNIDQNISNHEIMYSPESWLKMSPSQGHARICIKKEFKKQLLLELEMIGINGSVIYPDVGHKAQFINGIFE